MWAKLCNATHFHVGQQRLHRSLGPQVARHQPGARPREHHAHNVEPRAFKRRLHCAAQQPAGARDQHRGRHRHRHGLGSAAAAQRWEGWRAHRGLDNKMSRENRWRVYQGRRTAGRGGGSSEPSEGGGLLVGNGGVCPGGTAVDCWARQVCECISASQQARARGGCLTPHPPSAPRPSLSFSE